MTPCHDFVRDHDKKVVLFMICLLIQEPFTNRLDFGRMIWYDKFSSLWKFFLNEVFF